MPSRPLEEERELLRFVHQETRFAILQYVLAHPHHLASLVELDHAIPAKSTTSIREQVEVLQEHGLIARYEREENESRRDLPSTFYGPTAEGVEALHDLGFLRGVPVLQAMYGQMEKTDRVKRHEDAPRPDLPPEVRGALGPREGREEPDETLAEGPPEGTQGPVVIRNTFVVDDDREGEGPSNIEIDDVVEVP